MLEEGDSAPDFTAPMATPENAAGAGEHTAEDVESFALSTAFLDGPVVLAFFPGAFSRTCTEEMCTFRDWRRDLSGLDARVYGVSADTPWSLLAFIDQYDINYPLLSGFNNSVIEDYGVAIVEGTVAGIAGRAVFVVDASGTVTYRWRGDDIRELPDMDDIEAAVVSV
jgi:peroxiredoxin